MSDPKLLTISDFEWGSVGLYTHYISQCAELDELNMNRIYSFPLARLGVDKLMTQKIATEEKIKANLSRLEVFVGSDERCIKGDELVVIRSMYLQLKAVLNIVADHITALEALRKFRFTEPKDLGLTYNDEVVVSTVGEVMSDDAPF